MPKYILISHDGDRDAYGYTHTYFHVRGRIITREADTTEYRNPSFEWNDTLNFDNLEITCQTDENSGANAYGWRTEYRDVYSLDLAKAEASVKTLKMIQRGLDKLEDRFGHPSDFGQYLTRVGEVLKVDGYLRRVGPESGMFDRNTYQVMDASGARYHIDHVLRDFARDHAKEGVA